MYRVACDLLREHKMLTDLWTMYGTLSRFRCDLKNSEAEVFRAQMANRLMCLSFFGW